MSTSNEYSQIRARLGERIRFLREQKSISQEALATAAELDRTYISDMERGIRNVSLETLCKLARGFNINLCELFDHNA